MSIRKEGMAWFENNFGRPIGCVHVSSLYDLKRKKSWNRRREWWLEIPESETESLVVIHLLCQKEAEPCEFHRLDVPAEFLRENKDALYFREDTRKFSLYLSADAQTFMRELRGNGGIDFNCCLVS